MEYDKNYISTGVDVLIGTATKLNDMFTTAGFNVNRLKMFILDDADPILRLRNETKIMRISNSISKTQRIVFADRMTDRVEILVDKMLIEPFVFEMDEEQEDEGENLDGDTDSGEKDDLERSEEQYFKCPMFKN